MLKQDRVQTSQGIISESQFTNLTVFEKLFSNSNSRYYLFTGFIAAIIISKTRKMLQKLSMEAHRR